MASAVKNHSETEEWMPRYAVVTGRGSSAIYLLLRHLKNHKDFKNRFYMAPANVCYAALYPALYADWNVILADTDPVDGNLTWQTFLNAVEQKTKPDVLLIPHMYGQPVRDLEKIIDYCRKNQIIVIEDCAAAMGSKAPYPLGRMGDYSIFSTGYAKNIEVGYGGILGSEKDRLEWVKDSESELPYHSADTENTETLFSRLYRVLRNNPDNQLDAAVYSAMLNNSRNLFLFRLSEKQKQNVLRSLARLPEVTDQKRRLFEKYSQRLKESVNDTFDGLLEIYPYAPGAVPWRFSFFIDEKIRPAFIQECLNRSLPVSDWYPSSAPMIADDGDYPNAEYAAGRIVNFPLQEGVLESLCQQINSILQEAAGDVLI